ncbi:heat-inducible transcription repressor HrcA [candidate division KSB1 bacterium]|nr:heat-inducible transcription repressor HrcA [candidate division KSB1 bacterium]NIS26235.1 heat-inducible transcription repressor HrcA [candidate division KSB1 bacterium]NIU26883.1 heat-inducible transcription repressor HrcA [candidate division KSB1 bacterium]NIU92467.1 heat-inducible transcription repressor HrcA [candidate division KSB1 bacterium]NIW20757.1 heat-inducible transcription repressor HrcA [candidate division KSB1 bacterium]
MILNCIVDSYVSNAKPVGSRYLSKKYRVGVSPATIRNVMNDLEDRGYLKQPHVSAGRVPTDHGYRLYVDSIMGIPTLSKRERQVIADNLRVASEEEDEIFGTSSRVLSKISSQLAIVLEPRFDQGVFQKMELISMADRKVLVVIMIKSGFVRTVMLELDSDVNSDSLSKSCWFVNERLSGLSIREILDSVEERLSGDSIAHNQVVQTIVNSSRKLFNFKDENYLHFGGMNYLLSNPEFSNREYALKILQLIESKQALLNYLDEISDDKISIRIGKENEDDMFRDYSIVSVRYHRGNVSGTLGVVGPTRMRYARMMSLVDYMGKYLTQILDTQSS